jgi:hypothetical protein
MTSILSYIGQNIAAHAEAYSVGIIAVVVAAIKCMPKPGSPLSWLTIYTWFYDTAQAAVPVPRNSQSANGTLNGTSINVVPPPALPPAQPVYPVKF